MFVFHNKIQLIVALRVVFLPSSSFSSSAFTMKNLFQQAQLAVLLRILRVSGTSSTGVRASTSTAKTAFSCRVQRHAHERPFWDQSSAANSLLGCPAFKILFTKQLPVKYLFYRVRHCGVSAPKVAHTSTSDTASPWCSSLGPSIGACSFSQIAPSNIHRSIATTQLPGTAVQLTITATTVNVATSTSCVVRVANA